MSGVFLVLAVFAGLFLLLVAGKLLLGPGRAGRVDGERLPATPLERRAWVGLALGALVITAAVVLIAVRGLERYDSDPATRFGVYGLLLLGLVSQGVVMPWSPSGRRRLQVDERDVRTLERAPAYQGIAVLLSLAVWAVGLTESYNASGTIPIVFPSLIFLSSLLVHSVALSAGILIGSRRLPGDAEG